MLSKENSPAVALRFVSISDLAAETTVYVVHEDGSRTPFPDAIRRAVLTCDADTGLWTAELELHGAIEVDLAAGGKL